ncbi:MAG: phosphoribosylformylglycinamidine synthase II, partial [Clostridia bacterium]|nr:phosphoribosylformylglycinamidine synthase II [Clostridia bacterium]
MTAPAATERARAVGLTDAEYERAVRLLGREPNDLELGLIGVMWSEHCSYKSSRLHLRRLPGEGPHVLLGPGENAGVLDVGDGWAVALRCESHNHPSAVEPFQGAATGVGGILRDIFTVGARPIALLDSLRFGDPDKPRTRFLLNGVVAGISFYGNCVGVPTVGGEVFFDSAYDGNPLVNVLCLGLLRRERLVRGRAEGVGNSVLLVGARTGRDGIHGASLLASQGFAGEGDGDMRPAVQVGDPFKEKLLIEACLEALASGAVVGLNDLGAAGLTSACAETAARAGRGMVVDVALVPRREPGM